MVSSTPEGTGIGCLPMRDISRSPHLGDELAANAVAASVVSGHQALGGGDDRSAHAAEDARDVLRGDVGAPAGLGDSLEPGDHRRAALRVLEPHVQLLADASALDRPALDVALLLQDARELGL